MLCDEWQDTGGREGERSHASLLAQFLEQILLIAIISAGFLHVRLWMAQVPAALVVVPLLG